MMSAPTSALPSQPQRRRPFLRVLAILLFFLLGSTLFLTGRTGLIPGLSPLVGASKPRDLGVRPTPEEFKTVLARIGYTLNNEPTATNPVGYRKVYQGQIKVDQVLTESELSALLTYNHVSWWPMRDVQLRVHADGMMEVSLNLITRNIPWEQMPATIARQLPGKLPDTVPIYLKGRISPVGPSNFTTELASVEVGRVALPEAALAPENQRLLSDLINSRAAGIPGFTVESLSFTEGRLHFRGTFPQSFTRTPVAP